MKQILIWLLSGTVLLSSCINNQKDKRIKMDYKLAESNMTIKFDSLEKYNPFKVKDSSSYDYYVVSYVNTECPICLSELDQWSALSNTLLKHDCGIRIVGNSDDYFEYFKYLCQTGELNPFLYPFLMDASAKYRFGIENSNFLKDSAVRTVLINRRNNVLAIGNPVHNKEILSDFFQIIDNQRKNARHE